MRGNSHARCEAGENLEIISKSYLSLFTISGGFAPNSESANIISKALGSRTVLSGSVSRGKNDPSQSLQMIERPLMTADELKSMKKGRFIVMKTGCNPFISRLKLFFKWGIIFDESRPYTLADKGARAVAYVTKEQIENAIEGKFPPPVSGKVNTERKPIGRPDGAGVQQAPMHRKRPAGQMNLKTGSE